MSIADNYAEVAGRFGAVSKNYCDIVDSSSSFEKSELLNRIYEVLPALIDAAIHLPDAGTLLDVAEDQENKHSVDAHRTLSSDPDVKHNRYRSLKEKLGDTDTYRMVFNAAGDDAAIHGSLADDITDIYLDLKDGLVLMEKNTSAPQDALWEWRFGFDSHWGHHAMNALKTIHDIRNY
jgi:hypothetical protein